LAGLPPSVRSWRKESYVPDVWYQVRKKIGDIRQNLPQGIVGPFFNDEFGDTYGIIYAFTADGFTQRELRDYVESARTRLLAINDVSKIDIFGAQDEKIYVEFSSQKLAGLRLDRQALIQAIQAQNAVTPAGIVQTSDEAIRVDVTGGFRSEADLRNVNFVANGQIFRLSDIATVKRTYSDRPQPMFRINGQAAIGIGISMRAGGDVLALGQNVEQTISEIRADTLPRISRKLSRPRWMISWKRYGRPSASCSP
jgi:multidrug efflux pump